MPLEWHSPQFPSNQSLESNFSKFTAEIEKAGGIFDGYDETCHRSRYLSPNGVKQVLFEFSFSSNQVF